MTKIPRQIPLPGGPHVPIMVHRLPGDDLGSYGTDGIEIDDRLTNIQSMAILIHELMHAVESEMKECGALKQNANVPHQFICGFSYAAIVALGGAGLLSGVTKAAARKFAKDSGSVPDWGKRKGDIDE